eukprot:TRINITY_DN27640_c0_g1_i1.p1 TRINITY_DN27640_c0_g1~~TRINITY_DN27640_c0_g1_i1.p1  ORF type:complete len:237 (+),score=68.36 TRINITY_DN27640_c0_g1_i1:32-742(+)
MSQAKKQKTAEPTEAQVKAVLEAQEAIDTIDDEFDTKVLDLQETYNKKKRPVYNERNKVIATIPNFWFQAFSNHRELQDLIGEGDQERFGVINELDVEESGNDIKLIVRCKANDFFTNKEIWKSLKVVPSEDGGTETKVEQSGVDWKPGKNPQKSGGGAGSKRKADEMDEEASFFQLFELPDDDGDEEDDAAIACQILTIVKDTLWVDPLKYFSGEVDDSEDEEEEGPEEEGPEAE